MKIRWAAMGMLVAVFLVVALAGMWLLSWGSYTPYTYGMMGGGRMMIGPGGFGLLGMLGMLIVPLGFVALIIVGIVWLLPSAARPVATAIPAVPAKTCSNCGKPTQADWKLCPHCGTALVYD